MTASLVLFTLSVWLRHALPAPAELRPELRNEPTQVETGEKPFQTTVGGVTYTVKPIADYEIWGLVVSEHASDTWWDWVHEAWNDKLNVIDLCVVFAENVERGGYVGISYSSGSFVCYAETRSSEAWRRFSMRALSNNHLLADRAHVATRLKSVQVGDQVRIRGWLAEYQHDQGFAFKRGTSLTRDDTGNGACETIFVQDVEILRRGGGFWRWMTWPAVGLLVLGFVLWFRAPLPAR